MPISSYMGAVDKGMVPVASAGERKTLLTAAGVPFSGAAGTTVLPASGAWTQSEIIACRMLRRITLEVAYDAHASTTMGYPQLFPILCSQFELPAIGDDVWFVPAVSGGTVTAGALTAGTIGAGSDYTVTASWGSVDYQQMVINCKAALANSDKLRMRFDIDVTDAAYFALQAREIGDTTNRGILNLAIVGGC
jgi:hypothetical protein